jgi:hypothetical protein
LFDGPVEYLSDQQGTPIASGSIYIYERVFRDSKPESNQCFHMYFAYCVKKNNEVFGFFVKLGYM